MLWTLHNYVHVHKNAPFYLLGEGGGGVMDRVRNNLQCSKIIGTSVFMQIILLLYRKTLEA